MKNYSFSTTTVLLLAALRYSASFVTPPPPRCVHHRSSSKLPTSSSLAAATAEPKAEESASYLSSIKEDDVALLLDDALKYNTNNSSSTLVNNLMTLRQSDPMAAEGYLDGILSIIATCSNKRTLVPRLSTRLSRTARLRSMSRVLDVTTPSPDMGEAANNDAADDEVAAGRRNAVH